MIDDISVRLSPPSLREGGLGRSLREPYDDEMISDISARVSYLLPSRRVGEVFSVWVESYENLSRVQTRGWVSLSPLSKQTTTLHSQNDFSPLTLHVTLSCTLCLTWACPLSVPMLVSLRLSPLNRFERHHKHQNAVQKFSNHVQKLIPFFRGHVFRRSCF